MATYDLRKKIAEQYPHDTSVVRGGSPVVKMSKILDTEAATVVKGSALTTADIAQLFDIPAYALIQAVMINVLTTEGAACTIDVGDSGSASRYANDLDVNATGLTVYSTNYSVGATAIDFRVTFNTAATNLFKAEIAVCYLDMSCTAS
jgi:hypothetical protein